MTHNLGLEGLEQLQLLVVVACVHLSSVPPQASMACRYMALSKSIGTPPAWCTEPIK